MDKWKYEYLKQYKRVNGRDATLEYLGGGWHTITTHQGYAIKYRKKQILRMIESLKELPDKGY
jgi:hypothetical protein